jgi:hypothetical protein
MAPKRVSQPRLQTLNDQRHQLQQQIRSVQLLLRIEKERPRKHLISLLKSAKYKTMCSLMVLTDGNLRSVERFAQISGISSPDLQAMLSSLKRWHGTLSDTREDYYNRVAADPHLRASLKKASSFLQAEKLERWITDTNVTKGITPSSQSCIAQLKKEVGRHPPVCEASLPPLRKKYAFQWLRRWRRRWGCSIQALPALQHLTAAEKYAKAGATKKQPLSGLKRKP